MYKAGCTRFEERQSSEHSPRQKHWVWLRIGSDEHSTTIIGTHDIVGIVNSNAIIGQSSRLVLMASSVVATANEASELRYRAKDGHRANVLNGLQTLNKCLVL